MVTETAFSPKLLNDFLQKIHYSVGDVLHFFPTHSQLTIES